LAIAWLRGDISPAAVFLIGSGMALAGIILGYLSILFAVMTIHDSSRSLSLARNVQTSLNDLECDEGESKFSSSNFSDFREPGGFVSFPVHR